MRGADMRGASNQQLSAKYNNQQEIQISQCYLHFVTCYLSKIHHQLMLCQLSNLNSSFLLIKYLFTCLMTLNLDLFHFSLSNDSTEDFKLLSMN